MYIEGKLAEIGSRDCDFFAKIISGSAKEIEITGITESQAATLAIHLSENIRIYLTVKRDDRDVSIC